MAPSSKGKRLTPEDHHTSRLLVQGSIDHFLAQARSDAQHNAIVSMSE
ncbi:hypothetical protein KIPB_013157, partial [Kipferlia bialata]|eukprot:g13157.t1